VTSQMVQPWLDGFLAGAWYHDAFRDPLADLPAAASDPTTFGTGATFVTAYRSTTNRVITRRRVVPPNIGFSWQDLTSASGVPALAAGKPFGVIGLDGIEDVVFRGTNNRIYEIYRQTNGTYGWGDLLDGTGAPLAAGDPSAIVMSDGSYHVFYRGQDAHVHELLWVGAGHVAHDDLTARAGAGLAGGDPVVYGFGGERHVVYKGTNANVYELESAPDGWHSLNLTYLTHGPTVIGNLSAYVSSIERGIVFRGADNAVWALWNTPGHGWTTESLTLGTGAPKASSDPFGYFDPYEGLHHIVYRAVDNHVWEMGGTLTGAFGRTDLTVASGAPTNPVAAGAPSALPLPLMQSRHLVYRDAVGGLHELRTPRRNL
jgi:hypothetical protein